MKKIFLFSLMLFALQYSVVGQSVLIRPNSASPLSVKSSVTNYGNISTTSSSANLVFRINEPTNGSGASGSVTGAIESSGTEVSYNGYSGMVGLYGATSLRLGTNGNRDRMIMLSNGNVGVNLPDPKARLEIFQTSPIVASGWGGYVGNLKASAFFNGTHATLNESPQAIGVATHGNWSSTGNIGLLGTAGNTAIENVGVMGYTDADRSGLISFIGVKGVVKHSQPNNAYGIYGSVEGNNPSGQGARFGVYGVATGTGYLNYGVYGSASGGTINWAGYFSGNVYTTGTYQSSDKKLKHKITSLQNSINHLSQLNGYHYYWKDQERDQSLQTGLIAQEVEKLFPELIQKDEKGFLSVNYVGLIPHLIEAIKDLKTENESLQSDISEIKSLVAKLAKSESVSVPTEGKK